MQIIRPIHSVKELKNLISKESLKCNQVENDKYHLVYYFLSIVFVLSYIYFILKTVPYFHQFVTNRIYNMFNTFIQGNEKYLSKFLILFSAVTVLFAIFISYLVITFKLTRIPIKLLKKYWNKKGLWKTYNEILLNRFYNLLSTMEKVEEITILPQNILDETDVYKETDRLVFKIKEGGYIIEKTLVLDENLKDICKPNYIDFSMLDSEIDLLIEKINN